MSGMVVAHNLQSMFSNRALGIVNDRKAKSSEKLASGYKINRAADDASGLSISEKMRKKIRGLNQGAENILDGISLCQVADGALAETQDILQRINQLAIKSANGTMSPSDRADIQQEVGELKIEIDRIANTTRFNEIYPLRFGSADSINNTISITEEDFPEGISLRNVNVGKNITWNGESYSAGSTIQGMYICLDTNQYLPDVNTIPSSHSIVGYGFGYWTHKGGLNGLIGCIPITDNYDGSVGATFVLHKNSVSNLDNLVINEVSLGNSIVAYDADSSDGLINFYDRFGNKYNFGVGAYGGEGGKGLIYAYTYGEGELTEEEHRDYYFHVDLEKMSDKGYGSQYSIPIQCSDENKDHIEIHKVDATLKSIGLLKTDLSTLEGARSAIDTVGKAVKKVSGFRSYFGAQQNRLEHAYKINQNSSENTQYAESVIRDTDMALEMVKFSKESILQQAGQSMLAQANQSNQGVLTLLQ